MNIIPVGYVQNIDSNPKSFKVADSKILSIKNKLSLSAPMFHLTPSYATNQASLSIFIIVGTPTSLKSQDISFSRDQLVKQGCVLKTQEVWYLFIGSISYFSQYRLKKNNGIPSLLLLPLHFFILVFIFCFENCLITHLVAIMFSKLKIKELSQRTGSCTTTNLIQICT